MDDGDGGITDDTATINVLASALGGTWTGGSVVGNLWSDAANWAGNRVPQSGSDLIFPATAGRFAAINDFPDDTMFRSITIEGGSYDMGGNRLLLGEGGLVVNGGSHTLSASYEWIVSPFCRLRAEAGAVVTMSGVIGGEGLQKQGKGMLILTAANTISGEILVEDGELVVRHSMALGSPAVCRTPPGSTAAAATTGSKVALGTTSFSAVTATTYCSEGSAATCSSPGLAPTA